MKRLAIALAAFALLAGACGDDDSADDRAGTDEATSEGTGDTTTTAAPDDTAAPDQTTTTAPSTTTAPTDRSEPGPYGVGVTTLDLGDRLAEVYYPTDPDAGAGAEPERYTQLEPLPDEIRTLLADIDYEIVLDAYRDVPASTDGPFPVVQYSHGFGGFRKIVAFHATHLASWGFVVTSTDHVERGLLAVNGFLEVDESVDLDRADVGDLIATLDLVVEAGTDPDSVLAGTVDPERVAVMGHSAGGSAAVEATLADDRYDTFVSWASGGDPETRQPDVPALFVVADGDTAVEPERSRTFYDALTIDRRWVVLADAGHNSFTDACVPIYERGGLADVAEVLGLPPSQTEAAENGCVEGFTDPVLVFDVLNHLGLAHLLDVFGMDETAADLEPEAIETLFGDLVAEVEVTPAG